jgi:hypothetical protein
VREIDELQPGCCGVRGVWWRGGLGPHGRGLVTRGRLGRALAWRLALAEMRAGG